MPDYVNETAHVDVEDCGRIPGHFLQQKCSSKLMVLMNLFILVSRLQPCYCPQNLQIHQFDMNKEKRIGSISTEDGEMA